MERSFRKVTKSHNKHYTTHRERERVSGRGTGNLDTRIRSGNNTAGGTFGHK